MKILVVKNMIPFQRDHTTELAHTLVQQLGMRGFDAELLQIPFQSQPAERIYHQILLCRMLQLYDIDRVIGLQFPAYLIPHHHKVLWLQQQFRSAYDLFGTLHNTLSGGRAGRLLKHAIGHADNTCFASCKAIFTQSEVTRARLKAFNGFESDILYPPIEAPELFVHEEYGDYVFCGGCINSTNRQFMLVEAMRFVRTPGKLFIAGSADRPEHAQNLRELVERHGLKDRVRLEIGAHSRSDLARWLRNALASVFIPIDEESPDCCALEAFQASKAVLTANDSLGIANLVTDQKTGWISEPTVATLTQTLEQVFTRRQDTIQMGAAASEAWSKRQVNWDTTIQRLTT